MQPWGTTSPRRSGEIKADRPGVLTSQAGGCLPRPGQGTTTGPAIASAGSAGLDAVVRGRALTGHGIETIPGSSSLARIPSDALESWVGFDRSIRALGSASVAKGASVGQRAADAASATPGSVAGIDDGAVSSAASE